ncbi:hypothetical protein E0Z10_g7490 [Xylaria hypoxylon]|uniref:Fork-head domain-containing protein n=1 Tax=Xylaria hypoxylon TaxID=37992 RepID=A0A4Z0YDQ6_9PEZI|nr:hypothetical protein E0Z10_g7490 [Xylaria hypoxylon]
MSYPFDFAEYNTKEADNLLQSESFYTTASSSSSPVNWPSVIQQMNHTQFSWDSPGYNMGPYVPLLSSQHPRRVPSPSPEGESQTTNSFQLEEEQEEIEPAEQSAEEEEQKASEPYARLIYKAFMSRKPNYSMSLQEIYQWFRDHTEKATSNGKGWQNSIRHNLSMNAAFSKAESKPSDIYEPAICKDTKKSTEWVLEDWAVTSGVQSTTRYRKGNPARRRGSSTRTSTRRRGGVNNNKNKSIRTRRPVPNHAASTALLSRYIGAASGPSTYSQPLDYNFNPNAFTSNPPNPTDWTGHPTHSVADMPPTSYEMGGYVYNNSMSPVQGPAFSQRELPQDLYQAPDISGAYGGPQHPLETVNPFAWNPAVGGDMSYYSAP